MVKRIDYDSFGNIIDDTNPTFEVPFCFAGGLHDRDTGLVRFGYRDYDPDIGRWTAKDPIFFAGGDTDLYGYCLNNPIHLIDHLGLSATGSNQQNPCESEECSAKKWAVFGKCMAETMATNTFEIEFCVSVCAIAILTGGKAIPADIACAICIGGVIIYTAKCINEARNYKCD